MKTKLNKRENARRGKMPTVLIVLMLLLTAWVNAGQTAPHDVNGNGLSDVLMKNMASGQVVLLLMNANGTVAADRTLSTDLNATIVGTGDFNGDGICDLIFKNDTTGKINLWFMNADGTSASFKTLLTDVNSTVAGVADINHDGVPDILFHNLATGRIYLWFMNADGSRSSFRTLLADPDSTVVGTGDVDGDGIPDIFMRNNSTGKVNLWFMNADGTSASLKTLLTATDWTIAATGDINGDGRTDLIWRNTDGVVRLWLMNIDGSHAPSISLLSLSNWDIAGTGDFNGDGRTDLLWRSTDGLIRIWFMNASGSHAAPVTLLNDPGWTIQPVPELLKVIVFVTEGSSFAPVIVVDGTPEIRWTWADGATSRSAAPAKNYGTARKRLNTLSVKPWSAIRRINIGYDAGDGGSSGIEYVADQHVSSVQGLEIVAPYLAQWCSSYNELTSLNFSNFKNLDTIESFLSQTMTHVYLANTPKLKRACFEDNNLVSLDLSGSPLLEDLRGAQNNYPTINFGSIGSHVWHICVHDSSQMTNQSLFADMTPFPNLSDFFIWNDNQAGVLRIPATSPTNYVSLLADGNHYSSLNLTGALSNSLSQATVSFRNNSLTSIDISGCSQITELYLENNLLGAGQLDTLLGTLDSLGRSSVNTNPDAALTADLRGNADPGADGYSHAVSLAAKGWTVLATSWSLSPPPPENNGETRIDFRTGGDTTGMRCDFRGTETTATWHWSDGTTSAAVSGADAVKSGLGDGNHDHYLIISNGAALTRFGAAGGGGNGHLASITGFEKCTHLGVLYAYNESSLSALGRLNTTLTKEYHLMGTALSAAAMDQIFADAVATTVTSGTMWCNNQGTAASDADRAKLVSRGWSL